MSDAREKLRALLIEHSIQFGNFTLASGEQSSVYLDVRKTALRADGATWIGELLEAEIQKDSVLGVGGMTLGADPLLSAIAITSFQKKRRLDAIIVRKEPKGHGAQNQLEIAGGLPHNAQIAVVDDVVTTAGSTIKAILALRKAGFQIKRAYCVVDRQAGGEKALADIGVSLYSIFSLSEFEAK